MPVCTIAVSPGFITKGFSDKAQRSAPAASGLEYTGIFASGESLMNFTIILHTPNINTIYEFYQIFYRKSTSIFVKTTEKAVFLNIKNKNSLCQKGKG
jgi:hypothetical protein